MRTGLWVLTILLTALGGVIETFSRAIALALIRALGFLIGIAPVLTATAIYVLKRVPQAPILSTCRAQEETSPG